MWLKCARARIKNHVFMQFMGHQADYDDCSLRLKCLRNPRPKAARQVHILLGVAKTDTGKTSPIERMKQEIYSALGRHIYSQRSESSSRSSATFARPSASSVSASEERRRSMLNGS